MNRHSNSGASNKMSNFKKGFGGRTSSMGDNEKLMMNVIKLNEYEHHIKSNYDNIY